jgi:cohesin complex subunit SA-1/2
MIEQALNVLNLHIIWKARELTSATDPSADEIQYRDSLREQRESLMEKLVEYAVGTHSNTAEGVKRTVSRVAGMLGMIHYRHTNFCRLSRFL